MRPPKPSAGIIDIARDLNLSAMTVSRALNQHPEISQEIRRRVREHAKSIGYTGNRWGRSLETRRSLLIGVVLPDLAHTFFTEILAGIEAVTEKAGYDLFLCHSRRDPRRELSELEVLIGSCVDGLIIAPTQPEDSTAPLPELVARDIPVVLVDRFFLNRAFSCVRVDDAEAGRMATRHLIELGHTAIAHISCPVSSGLLRKQAFQETIAAAGLPRLPIVAGDALIESGRRGMERLLRSKTPPTAVFAANDPMGIGAVYACREAGLRVPEDISIVGAGNIEGLHHPNPFLTTMDWPREAIGRVAAEILLADIDRPSAAETEPAQTSPTIRIFPPSLLVRQSTAPVRR